MSRKIKLIWDFRGPDAGETARHHEHHLKEYSHREMEGAELTGHSDFSDNHSIAYLVVEEKLMIPVRDALIPHRGEIYDQ